MPWLPRTNFNAGVLDPALNDRTELNLYYAGLKQGTNVVSVPQGGVRRRPGLEYAQTLRARSRLIPFEFNVEQTYVVVLSAGFIDVYDSDGAAVTTGIVTTYTEAECFELDYAQSADTMVLVHEEHQPQQLIRSSSGAFSLSNYDLDGVPQYDFNDASSPSGSAERQDLQFDSSTLNGDEYRIELNGLETDTIRFSSQDSENISRIQKALLDLPNTGSDGITVSTIVSASKYRIEFTGASANDWELISCRYVYAQDAATNGFTITRNLAGSPRTEDVWSATRGWPRTVTFHENRLFFGGSKSLPDTLWGSRVNQFNNFDTYRARDDDAINVTLATDQVNVIQGIKSGRRLQIFTSGAEFYVPQPNGTPITPETISILRQTSYGSRRIKPIIIDGSTLFAEREGIAIREFVYSEAEGAFTAPPINIRAPSLFNAPVDMAAVKGDSTFSASYVYVVNGDGTMAVLNTLRSEQITAWTRWTTSGTFESVTVIDKDTWFCVGRTINGASVYFLERANESHRLDASVLQTGVSSTTVTGLGHLDGEACRVRDRNLVLNDNTPASGSITTEESVEDPEVGLGFSVTLETMPVVQLFAGGATTAFHKRLVRTNADLLESLGVLVEGDDLNLADFSFPVTLGQSPNAFTGRVETYHDSGFVQDELTITITQTDPLPFHLRGFEAEVAY